MVATHIKEGASPSRVSKMKTDKEVIADIESLAKFFRVALQNPKNSPRANEIYTLTRRLNKVLDKVLSS